MKHFAIFLILFVAFQLNIARDENSVKKDYDEYDDDSFDDSYEDDKTDLEFNSIGEKDELRQFIFNPRKRRQRRRERRAAYNELTSLNFCWQKHDDCDNLKHNEYHKSGFINEEEQQLWHCNCDTEFYQCLHRLNSTLSSHIGELYFKFHHQCYRSDFEIQECLEYDSFDAHSEERCVQYLLLLGTPNRYQWFDLPYYSGKPVKTPIYDVN